MAASFRSSSLCEVKGRHIYLQYMGHGVFIFYNYANVLLKEVKGKVKDLISH